VPRLYYPMPRFPSPVLPGIRFGGLALSVAGRQRLSAHAPLAVKTSYCGKDVLSTTAAGRSRFGFHQLFPFIFGQEEGGQEGLEACLVDASPFFTRLGGLTRPTEPSWIDIGGRPGRTPEERAWRDGPGSRKAQLLSPGAGPPN